jgi:hypothetical protein
MPADASAQTLLDMRRQRADAVDRMARIGHFERQLAEGAEADYPKVCNELLGFVRDTLNSYLELIRSVENLAQSVRRDDLDQQIQRFLRDQ